MKHEQLICLLYKLNQSIQKLPQQMVWFHVTLQSSRLHMQHRKYMGITLLIT